MEEMISQKIDDALSRRKDRLRQMVLKEDPFTLEIMATPLPKILYVAPYSVMCQSFLLTLRREVKDWEDTLAPWPIRAFDELSRNFVACFLSSKKRG